jgi:hypothetical protein
MNRSGCRYSGAERNSAAKKFRSHDAFFRQRAHRRDTSAAFVRHTAKDDRWQG